MLIFFIIVIFKSFLSTNITSTPEQEEPIHDNMEENFPDTDEGEQEIKKRKYSGRTEMIITENLSLLIVRCSISDRYSV